MSTVTSSPAVVAASDERLALLAKALGHPARVRILRLLLAREAMRSKVEQGRRSEPLQILPSSCMASAASAGSCETGAS